MLLKKYPSIFAFFLLATFFVSCEKEAIAPTSDPVVNLELSPKEYLSNHAMQPVLFQYVVHNENTGRYAGWVIDNGGKLRKYSLDQTPAFADLSLVFQKDMRWLNSAAQEAEFEVDLDELVDHFKKVRHLNLTNISNELNPNASEGVTANFYAFKLDQSNQRGTDTSCGCNNSSGGCGNVNYEEKDLVRVLLYEEGEEIRTNDDQAALAMMDFLSTIKEAN